MTFDLYEEITSQIIAMLDQGVVPWRSPILGRSSAGHPKNLESAKPYRGVNVFLLAFRAFVRGYGSSYWLTFNQARAKGGAVKKGEKASLVVFWKQYEANDKETGDAKNIPVLRYYKVFNVDQCEGLAVPDVVPFVPADFHPIEAADLRAKGYADGPTVEHGGQQAFYRPDTDRVQMPDATRFASSEEYYSTLFHELTHSTGHSKRLDRGLDTHPKPFGSPDYGREELIAEMAAAFLCGEVGIMPAVIDNQAAYIDGWLGQLKKDKKLVISAAGAAQKACDWIRGEPMVIGTILAS
jgi:antirestriction protein ArdC